MAMISLVPVEVSLQSTVALCMNNEKVLMHPVHDIVERYTLTGCHAGLDTARLPMQRLTQSADLGNQKA